MKQTRPVGVGLVGFGSGGAGIHAPLITATRGLRLAAICVASETGARRARDEYRDVAVERDVARVLANPEVRLVVVATPNGTHAAIATAAIQAGRDVVVEKPMATSTIDARRLLAESQVVGCRVAVFANRRWDGDFVAIRRTLADGQLGQPVRLESRWERHRPVVSSGTWKDDATVGGGLLWNLLPHLVDQALVLFGPAAWVSARLETRRPDAGADDESWVTIGHVNGTTSWLVGSYVPWVVGPRFRLVGTDATYVGGELDPDRRASTIEPHLCEPDGAGIRLRTQARVVGSTGQDAVAVPSDDHATFYRGVSDAIANGGPFPVSAEDGVAVVDVLVAAAHSASQGCMVVMQAPAQRGDLP